MCVCVCVCVCGWMLSTQQYRCHHSVDTRYPYHPLTISFVHQMMTVSPCNVTALAEASGEISGKQYDWLVDRLAQA